MIEDEVAAGRMAPQAQLIKQLHYELLRDVDPEEAGQYRADHRRISGSQVMTSMPSVIPAEIASLAQEIAKELAAHEHASIRDTITLAATAHHEVTRIHPFGDGNGRVARLYMNYICRFRNLPYVTLPKVGMNDVMNLALKQADAGDITHAINLYATLLENSFDRILAHHGAA